MRTESTEPLILSFVVEGQPIAQPRQRYRILWAAYALLDDVLHACADGRELCDELKKVLRADNYTPSRHPVNAWKEAVGYAGKIAVACAPQWYGKGPLACLIRVYSPRPKTKVWKRKPMAGYWDERSSGTGGGDFDNHAKAITDALSGITYKDDKQICFGGPVEKRICSGDEKPRAVIVFGEVTTDENGCVVDVVELYKELERAATMPAAVTLGG
ncbi:hypothetical protein LCGC14_1803970 [marine sediment metagenome]|uniref:Uncharacterized protein n=1 Tax=marine sediment metagenome TaxID=412755 RepID=A0A0F9HBL4_9ZZZZ